jgi:lambda repressor-like predicted transcriptional regulator
MTPEKKRTIWLLYQLRKRGASAAEVARRVGTTRGKVSDVMMGRAKGQKVRVEVARILGVPVEKIWKDEVKNGT